MFNLLPTFSLFLSFLLVGCSGFRPQYADKTSKLLDSDSADFQQSYSCEVSRRCSHKLADILVELGSTRMVTRQVAVSEIGCHGDAAKTAAPILRKLIQDPSPDIREWAVFALWQIHAAAQTQARFSSPVKMQRMYIPRC